jgi:hypothetical protein
MWLIHRRSEGEILRNGINWTRDWSTSFGVILRMGPIILGYRRRSPHIEAKKRNLFHGCYARKPFIFGGLAFDFNTNSLMDSSGKRLTIEFLLDFLDNFGEEQRFYTQEEVEAFIRGRKD